MEKTLMVYRTATKPGHDILFFSLEEQGLHFNYVIKVGKVYCSCPATDIKNTSGYSLADML